MIEIDSDSYIVGFWYASCPRTNNNWLCCIIRDPDNPKRYKGWYRFRYSKGDKIFDSDDEKTWVSFTSINDETEFEAIGKMNDMQRNAIKMLYPDIDCLMIQGDISTFLEKAKTKEWMHLKCVPLEDKDK
jgi:hypothetical protein